MALGLVGAVNAGALVASAAPAQARTAHNQALASVSPNSRAAHRQAAARLASAALAAGPGVTTTVSPPASIDASCATDQGIALRYWLHSLAPQTTVNVPPGDCFRLDGGVTLSFPVGLTINGGTWMDETTLGDETPPEPGQPPTPVGHAMFDILGGNNVTLENLTIAGTNAAGFHVPLAFEAGIELQGTIGATIANVSIHNVYGDGLRLEPLRGSSDHASGWIVNPVEQLQVSNLTIDRAGRYPITPISVDGATFTDVTITKSSVIDMEADQNDEGAKNVVFDHLLSNNGLSLHAQGPASGPITVENSTINTDRNGDVFNTRNENGKPDAGPMTFINDNISCGASVLVACFQIGQATTLVVRDSRINSGFPHYLLHGSLYRIGVNSSGRFVNNIIVGTGNIGRVDDSGFVSVTGGLYEPASCRWPNVCPLP